MNCQHIIWGEEAPLGECDQEATLFFFSNNFKAVSCRCELHKNSVNLFNSISKEEYETFYVLEL